MSHTLQVSSQHLSLQAQFLHPVFDLFKDFPALVRHLFRALESYGLRLADVRLDSSSESLGEINLRLSWAELATVRLYLDRIELIANYPPFVYAREGRLIGDLLDTLPRYTQEISYRAFGWTQEVHGALEFPVGQFLRRFSSEPLQGFGPLLGSGTVFYFGAEEDRLAGSVALDFSRSVEEGLFLKQVIMYDASQVTAADLVSASQRDFSRLISELGLKVGG